MVARRSDQIFVAPLVPRPARASPPRSASFRWGSYAFAGRSSPVTWNRGRDNATTGEDQISGHRRDRFAIAGLDVPVPSSRRRDDDADRHRAVDSSLLPALSPPRRPALPSREERGPDVTSTRPLPGSAGGAPLSRCTSQVQAAYGSDPAEGVAQPQRRQQHRSPSRRRHHTLVEVVAVGGRPQRPELPDEPTGQAHRHRRRGNGQRDLLEAAVPAGGTRQAADRVISRWRIGRPRDAGNAALERGDIDGLRGCGSQKWPTRTLAAMKGTKILRGHAEVRNGTDGCNITWFVTRNRGLDRNRNQRGLLPERSRALFLVQANVNSDRGQ